jgi:hypothetical protein
MPERAGLFDSDDFDVTSFTPKKPSRQEQPPPEAVRAVGENANFRSREAAPVKASQPIPKKVDRRHRTGRNEQLNIKVRSRAKQMLYDISEAQGWVQGETLERALEALERELAAKR